MTMTRAHILLVEDNSFDAKVFIRALRNAKLDNPITIARDGVEAIDALNEYREKINQHLIVVTDVNMPRMNGIDFLRILRRNSDLKHIPVFVVTTSDASADRDRVLSLGVAGYICKTLEEEGEDILRPIIEYLTKRMRRRV